MKEKLNGLDKYVIFSISVVLIYTIAEFVTVTITGIEKQALTAGVYGFFGGEVVSAMLIKIFKVSRHDNECDWREHGHDDDIADSSVDSADL